MEKISISNVVEYRRKSSNSQVTFVNNLRKTKEVKNSDGGGNYWIHSLSTISTVFVSEQNERINEKIDILIEKHDVSTAKISKNMYQRNITILHNFEDFDFSHLKPNFELEYLPKPKDKSILTIEGLPVQILPNHVFTFETNNVKKIGAIWFVSKLDGYRIEELAFFTEAIYRYLSSNYSGKYEIDPDFCLSVDVMNLNNLRYTQILNKKVPVLLNQTLKSIKESL